VTPEDSSPVSGVPMPPLIYGTAWKKERTATLVVQALRAGFRGIDTACQPRHYDEAGVGAGLQAAYAELGLRREDLYVQTKFTPIGGQDPNRVPYDPRASLAEQVAQSCAVSLLNLHTNWLDGLILHSPLAADRDLMMVWEAMETLHAAGKARRLGISNCYDLQRLMALLRNAHVKPTIVQNRFHADTGFDRGIRAFCHENGLAYQSFWTLTANPHLLSHPVLRKLARQHNVEPAQILFRCLTQIGVTPLTGTTSITHMEADLAIFDFTLDEQACAQVASLFTPQE
jgi:diketogulonate reductase-like aldo/keto reductase